MSLSLLLSPNPLSVVNLHISISQAQAQQLGLVRSAAREPLDSMRWEVCKLFSLLPVQSPNLAKNLPLKNQKL